MLVPKGLLRYLSEGESIFYVSNNLIDTQAKLKKVKKALSILSIIVLIYYSIVIPNHIHKFLNISENPESFLLILLPILFIVITVIIIKTLWDSSRDDKYCIITDKDIIVYTYDQQMKSEKVKKIKLSLIFALKFIQSKSHKEDDVGEVEIVHGIEKLEKLKHISEFTKFQHILESISYHFGNIEENWSNLNQVLEVEYPMKFKQSYYKRVRLERSCRLRLFFSILVIVIFGILYFDLIVYANSLIFFSLFLRIPPEIGFYLGLILIPFFGISIPTMLLLERRVIKKRLPPKNSILVVEKNQFLIKTANSSQRIKLNKSVNISYVRFSNPLTSGMNWRGKQNGILVQSVNNSNKKIIFGPVENFQQRFSLCRYHCLKWKANQDLLIEKETLLANQIDRSKISALKSEKKPLYTEIKSEDEKKYNFNPIEMSSDEEKIFKKTLNSEETIYLRFTPKIKLKRSVWMRNFYLITFLTTLILTMALYVLINLYESLIFLGPFIMIFFIICAFSFVFLMSSSMNVSSKKKHVDDKFLISTEKILTHYRGEYLAIPYNLTKSIGKSKSRFSTETYKIQINLKYPIKKDLSYILFSIDIWNVPNERPLIDQIRYLKDNYLKNKK
ncbi:MAG: hypothetical protein GF317_12670 [Candidatus Lokiarchaeota archaeon]|nr:hypothetical protein [Candidatus Lokiarchaeota archaeon]MBD3200501.1 hypothetical protein [Candidatus Lokiarchaeota archaeon]